MKKYCVLGLLLLVAGCRDKNQFSTYGENILLYRGDSQVLGNCCTSAMSLMADDLKGQNQADPTPDIKTAATGFSSDGSGGRKVSNRTTMTISADGKDFRIEIVHADDHPTMVMLDYPKGDDRLVGHLTKQLEKSEVKPVSRL